MKQTKFRDDIKLNNKTLYVSIPKKSARSIGLKEGETVDVIIQKMEEQ